MAITSQQATHRPPLFDVHQLAEGDTVEDLNAWAISLHSPNFDPAHPAFEKQDDGIHAQISRGLFGKAPITVGAWIVLDGASTIRILGDAEFQQQYQLNG